MYKQQIQSIVKHDYEIPANANLEELTSQLLEHLASTDADDRENSTEILWQWGVTGKYSDEQLVRLGDYAAEHLCVGLGEDGTDTVFLRAFSALVLAMVLIADQRCELGHLEGREPFLSQEKVLEWFEITLAAFDGERDYRGFVDPSGWAHAVAHMSDALRDFSRSRHLDGLHLERLLQAIATKIVQPCDGVYRFDEDNRVVQVVMSLLRRDAVSADVLTRWLKLFSTTVDGDHWGDVFSMVGCDNRLNHARMNIRSFLRSF